MKPRPPRPPDDELATFVADPELAEMFMSDAIDQLGTIEGTILQLEASPGDLSLINEIFRPFHTVKANAGVLGIASIQEFAHKVETLLDRARSGRHPMGRSEIDLVLQTVDLLTRIVMDLPARAAGKPTTDVAQSRREMMARLDLLLAAESPDSAGTSPSVLQDTFVDSAGQSASGAQDMPGAIAAPPTADDFLPPPRWDDAHSSVRVGTRKLDELVEMVGELVIAQTILAAEPALLQSTDERLARRLAHVRRITSALQRDTMAMRMVPIRPTFRKMGRLLRDLSRSFDKPVNLVISGEETELDRKVVEHLTDPLTHMIRNAIDHGIEPAAVRLASGKPATATMRLSAFHRAGCIVVELADDGAGLNADAILARARALGMVPDGAQPSAAEVHQLIFRPGFSTTREVTHLSGRGVGLDVVRRNIEALRGRIDIQTTRGQGTVFSLQLPLTLAIIDGLLLGVGGDRFVIPAPAVQESVRPRPEHVHAVQGRQRMVQVRNQLVPLLHLGEAFGIAGARQAITESTVVIAEDRGRRIALVVDELLGKQEVVIKGLGDMFRGVQGIAGGAILGDGRIRLILDTGGLLGLLAKTACEVAA